MQQLTDSEDFVLRQHSDARDCGGMWQSPVGLDLPVLVQSNGDNAAGIALRCNNDFSLLRVDNHANDPLLR